MTRRLKLLTGLSTLAVIGAFSLAVCGGEGEGSESESGDTSSAYSGDSESEGTTVATGAEAESESASLTGDPASDDVEYLRLMGLVRGHLNAFIELYHGGEIDMALMHVKHPESELYSSLAPAFAARSKPGFADELKALADAASTHGDIDEAYSTVVDAIEFHTPNMSVAKKLLAVSGIVRTAADEFDIGVEDDGIISNMHEYQDAYGFLIASRDILSGIQSQDVDDVEAINVAHEQIEAALLSFDGLTASQTEGRASTIFGAAARVEIAARGLM